MTSCIESKRNDWIDNDMSPECSTEFHNELRSILIKWNHISHRWSIWWGFHWQKQQDEKVFQITSYSFRPLFDWLKRFYRWNRGINLILENIKIFSIIDQQTNHHFLLLVFFDHSILSITKRWEKTERETARVSCTKRCSLVNDLDERRESFL